MFFRVCACSRINFFQLPDGKRSLLRILSLVRLIKIREIRLTLLKLRNDQSHLISPIAEMNIPDHLISFITQDPFYTLPDDRRTQMTYMQRFCNIRTAVVDHDRLRDLFILNPQLFFQSHIIQVRCYALFGQLQVDKSWFHYIYQLKIFTVLQIRDHIFRDHKRRFLIFLCSRHRSVALIFAQIRAVGKSHFRKLFVITCLCKSLLHLYCNKFQ